MELKRMGVGRSVVVSATVPISKKDKEVLREMCDARIVNLDPGEKEEGVLKALMKKIKGLKEIGNKTFSSKELKMIKECAGNDAYDYYERERNNLTPELKKMIG